MPRYPAIVLALASAALAVPAVSTAQTAGYRYVQLDSYLESDDVGAQALAVADFSGDGRNDVVIATGDYGYTEEHQARWNRLFVYVQQQDGTLASPIKVPYGGSGGLLLDLRMRPGDFNRDGLMDLAISHGSGVSIALATGSGQFEVSVVELDVSGAGMQAFDVADLDGDRNLDFVRVNYQQDTIILFGNRHGGIREQRTLDAQGAWHQMLRIGDVNGDNVPDLVMSNQMDMRVYPGIGDGNFGTPRILPYHRDDPRGYRGLIIHDVNHDGRLDVVTTTATNQPKSSLHVFEQQADGSLASPPQDVETYDMAEAMLSSDVDRNGYADLLVMHPGWGAMGLYFQDRDGMEGEKLLGIYTASHHNPDGIATGDLTGDGCTDLALADYSNALQVAHARNCREPWALASDDALDFDGDGESDILWRSAGKGGRNVLWRSGRSGTRIPTRRVVDLAWHIAGTGDFDGDGRSDLFWRHAVSGQNSIWRGADQALAMAVRRVGDLDWLVEGIGDLDGDGRDDVIWRHRYTGQNRIWDGGSADEARNLTAVTDLDWRIAGVADFDGDGRDDILWRHRGDGRNTVWPGASYNAQQSLPTVADNAWQVAGVADFDGDGRSDLLWRHAFDGEVEYWPGASQASAVSLPQRSDLGWKVVGVADYAGDGKADILWRHIRTGNNQLWEDANSASRRTLGRVENMQWAPAR